MLLINCIGWSFSDIHGQLSGIYAFNCVASHVMQQIIGIVLPEPHSRVEWKKHHNILTRPLNQVCESSLITWGILTKRIYIDCNMHRIQCGFPLNFNVICSWRWINLLPFTWRISQHSYNQRDIFLSRIRIGVEIYRSGFVHKLKLVQQKRTC